MRALWYCLFWMWLIVVVHVDVAYTQQFISYKVYDSNKHPLRLVPLVLVLQETQYTILLHLLQKTLSHLFVSVIVLWDFKAITFLSIQKGNSQKEILKLHYMLCILSSLLLIQYVTRITKTCSLNYYIYLALRPPKRIASFLSKL